MVAAVLTIIEKNRPLQHRPAIVQTAFAAPQPSRRIALAWRKSFPPQAVKAVRQAVLNCKLPGVTPLPGESVVES